MTINMKILSQLACICLLCLVLCTCSDNFLVHSISRRGLNARYGGHGARRGASNNERISSGESENFDSERYLEKFGYLEEIEGDGQHSDAARVEAIGQFQDFNGLDVSGILDSSTLTKMQQPRCGVPDILPLRFSTHGNIWDDNVVTWRIADRTNQLPYSSQRRAFYNAFRKWSEVTPLRFREEASGNSDILIKFASYDHGDGAGNRFDGPGRTLAHAFFPGFTDISGDTHFDESEQWTENSAHGTNLEIVAAHEFGHALGMSHSRDTRALMAPYYQGYDTNYGLTADDIQGIQTLYGATARPVTQRPRHTPRPATIRPRRTQRPATRRPRLTPPPRRPRLTPPPTRRPRLTPPPTRRPRLTPPPTRRPRLTPPPTRRPRLTPPPTRRPRLTRPPTRRPPATRRPNPTTSRSPPRREVCDIRFDALVVAHDYNTYVFRGRKVYRLNRDGYGVAQKSNIQRIFPEAPINIGAAIYSIQLRKLYIFKGSRVWRYTGFSLDEGYPKTLHGFYMGIQSAIEWSDGDLYVFKGNRYSIWNEGLSDAPRGYPLSVSTYWVGVPSNTEAATRWSDGNTYFFKGGNYFKFNDVRGSVLRGYPKDKAEAWLGCGRRIPK